MLGNRGGRTLGVRVPRGGGRRSKHGKSMYTGAGPGGSNVVGVGAGRGLTTPVQTECHNNFRSLPVGVADVFGLGESRPNAPSTRLGHATLRNLCNY